MQGTHLEEVFNIDQLFLKKCRALFLDFLYFKFLITKITSINRLTIMNIFRVILE